MADQPVRAAQLTATPAEARTKVLGSFGFLHFVAAGNRLMLVDGERYMQVDIDSAAPADEQAHESSIRFKFVGYSETEAEDLFAQYLAHSDS